MKPKSESDLFRNTDSFKLGQKGKSALQDQESELNGKWLPFQDDRFLYKLGSCLSMKGFFRSPSWVSTPSALRQDTRSSAEFKVWSSENLVTSSGFVKPFESKKLQQFFKKCILLSISVACFWEAFLFNTHTKVKKMFKNWLCQTTGKNGSRKFNFNKIECSSQTLLPWKDATDPSTPRLTLRTWTWFGLRLSRWQDAMFLGDSKGFPRKFRWFHKPCNKGKHVIPINQQDIFSRGSWRYKTWHL